LAQTAAFLSGVPVVDIKKKLIKSAARVPGTAAAVILIVCSAVHDHRSFW
jgi:hypothetical protein